MCYRWNNLRNISKLKLIQCNKNGVSSVTLSKGKTEEYVIGVVESKVVSRIRSVSERLSNVYLFYMSHESQKY